MSATSHLSVHAPTPGPARANDASTRWSSSSATEQGPRHRNEDACEHDAGHGVFVVCDGMGRHAGGDVASRLAAETCARMLVASEAAFAPLETIDGPSIRAAAEEAVREAVNAAARAVYAAARADPGLRDMGTTLDVVVVRGRFAVVGHVGDGRVYLRRAGQVFALTEDHTVVAGQLRAGLITSEEAAVSPFRHVLARAIGPTELVDVDTAVVECVPGDLLLACTDGLHGAIDAQLPALLLADDDALAERLVRAARASGTTDNATCAVLRCGGPTGSDVDRLVLGKVDALRAVPLFEQFTYREKQAVLACASGGSFQRGEVVVSDGDASDDLYVVVRGRVAVEAFGTRLAVLEAGSHFGEMGLVDDTPRSATVRALADTDLLRLSREALWGLMRREPELGTKFSWALAQSLCQRLRNSNESYALAKSSGGYRLPGDHTTQAVTRAAAGPHGASPGGTGRP